eukprot:NODE_7835_length_740_cov_75.952998_g7584_i0.p1 GENE.NODE_7835_length_740_cov_75.952998_g7584_i0~~NODE_7835_length_740_cov_75.952998_g7584_i0.p1  ORF type:complete len:189 (+),score=7.46 NODE_7835_length_740_cov_75.952998_g7584_i0:59-625(+)
MNSLSAGLLVAGFVTARGEPSTACWTSIITHSYTNTAVKACLTRECSCLGGALTTNATCSKDATCLDGYSCEPAMIHCLEGLDIVGCNSTVLRDICESRISGSECNARDLCDASETTRIAGIPVVAFVVLLCLLCLGLVSVAVLVYKCCWRRSPYTSTDILFHGDGDITPTSGSKGRRKKGGAGYQTL